MSTFVDDADMAASKILEKIERCTEGECALMKWAKATKDFLSPQTPFEVHKALYNKIYEGCDDIKPCWVPTEESIAETNIKMLMDKYGFQTYQEFYHWSVAEDTREAFWEACTEAVNIQWNAKPSRIFDLSNGGAAHVSYYPDGELNIADSCFNKRESHEPALLYAMESDPRDLQHMSFAVLNRVSNQIANAIQQKLGLVPGEAIAICMPMTPESIAIYLGIIKAGCVVVSIADSFSAPEIEQRCRLGQAKAIFTQDVIYRGAKFLPLFTRILDANQISLENQQSNMIGNHGMKVVVLPGMLHAGPYPKLENMKRSKSGTWDDKDEKGAPIQVHDSVLQLMRGGVDWTWHNFLHHCSDEFTCVSRKSMDPCNILFSSGTTGEPKAIVWTHATTIKCAIDGFLHQDVRSGDRVVWPTNIGWMMGPWLLFQLINGATIGIFNGITSTDAFCKYVEAARMNMVGVIPSLVKAWQANDAINGCDWSHVRRFSSTGEASQPLNMLWLMSRVPGYAPVIEYCGGTEIGGSYLSSTMVQPNVPSMFATPVLGSALTLLSGTGEELDLPTPESAGEWPASVSGEIALVPPALGLSTQLLNKDHFTVYYKDMPPSKAGHVLRRHGDEIQLVIAHAHSKKMAESKAAVISARSAYYRALGRCDDTMNIGGIKISSVEIERVCNTTVGVHETAAIAFTPPAGGPSSLVIYTVLSPGVTKDSPEELVELKKQLQNSIKTKLNPLFHIYDIRISASLPRTASNKVMRRVLRDEYIKQNFNSAEK